jgi:MoaA/NifB/PqqE/SkfB family radical SAM enzyme
MQEKSQRPHWTLSLLDFFIRRRVLRQKIPLFASFKLTYRCNLACMACPFHRRAARKGSSIGWTGAIRALDELKRRGVRIVAFEGGEPFVWRDGTHDLRDIVEYAGKRFLRTAVTTNGTFPLVIPADALWVSLDGLNATHDKLRSGSFDKVWSNLEAAGRTRQRRVMVHFTLNRLNRRELEPLAAKLAGSRDKPAPRSMKIDRA